MYAAVEEMHGNGLGHSVGLVKYDLASSDKAVAATLRFGIGRTGGEAAFVPSSTTAAELKSEALTSLHQLWYSTDEACLQ